MSKLKVGDKTNKGIVEWISGVHVQIDGELYNTDKHNIKIIK